MPDPSNDNKVTVCYECGAPLDCNIPDVCWDCYNMFVAEEEKAGGPWPGLVDDEEDIPF